MKTIKVNQPVFLIYLKNPNIVCYRGEERLMVQEVFNEDDWKLIVVQTFGPMFDFKKYDNQDDVFFYKLSGGSDNRGYNRGYIHKN